MIKLTEPLDIRDTAPMCDVVLKSAIHPPSYVVNLQQKKRYNHLNTMYTDKPTRSQSSHGMNDSQTGQLAKMFEKLSQ